jgi:hypothetical protein
VEAADVESENGEKKKKKKKKDKDVKKKKDKKDKSKKKKVKEASDKENDTDSNHSKVPEPEPEAEATNAFVIPSEYKAKKPEELVKPVGYREKNLMNNLDSSADESGDRLEFKPTEREKDEIEFNK